VICCAGIGHRLHGGLAWWLCIACDCRAPLATTWWKSVPICITGVANGCKKACFLVFFWVKMRVFWVFLRKNGAKMHVFEVFLRGKTGHFGLFGVVEVCK